MHAQAGKWLAVIWRSCTFQRCQGIKLSRCKKIEQMVLISLQLPLRKKVILFQEIMSKPAEQFDDQTLTEHLRELRSCLIYSFSAIFIGFCLSYLVIRPIGTWFFKPLTEVLPEGTSLIFTSYQEGFFFI
jgi:sec-independent protein translocase protein TatC